MNKRIKKKKKKGYAKVASALIFGDKPSKNLTIIRSGVLFEAFENARAELIEKLKNNAYMEGPREDN